MRTAATGAAFAALLHLANAILVTQGSQCDSLCGNTLDATVPSDISCDEFSAPTFSSGSVFEQCVRCETSSEYTAGNETDLQWMLYNIRYATSYCLFGDPHNENLGTSQCNTDHACIPLKDAILWKNHTTKAGAYDYCSAWNDYYLDGCTGCLSTTDNVLRNFVEMMDTACQQKPLPGHTISIEGNPFSADQVNATQPTETPLYTYTPDKSVLNLGARVGIAIAGILLILTVAGSCIVWNGKRKRQAFLRDLEKRHAHQGWPHPKTPHGSSGGGPDMFETPLSQKPLRGWGDSPVSAVTETTEGGGQGGLPLPRYFSPYASTYNSPVSAGGGPSTANWPTLSPQRLDPALDDACRLSPHQGQGQQPPAFTHWPSSTQEKLMQMQHEREQQAAADIGIGIALGGDEASLRSKDSNPQLTPAAAAAYGYDPYHMTDAKGKDRDHEAYEMYAVESSSRSSPSTHSPSSGVGANPAVAGSGGHLASNNPYRFPVEPQAPVLHHPGYGRTPSLHKRSGTVGSIGSARYAGLTEEDARRGDAL